MSPRPSSQIIHTFCGSPAIATTVKAMQRDTGTPLYPRRERRAAGELGKGELMAGVRPNTLVEERNLEVQVAALRRALRDGKDGGRYISNVAGRGFWFVAPVARSTI